MDFVLDVDYRNGYSIVSITGDVDLFTSSALDYCLENIKRSGKKRVAINLQDCPYCDSEGIKVLFKWYRSLEGDGVLAICGAQAIVRRAFSIAGLDRLVELSRSVDELPLSLQ